MATFKAGKGGKITVGGTAMATKQWSGTLSADELDTSNFEGNGKKSYLIGLQGFAWSLGTLWDSAAIPTGNPPGLYVRDDGTDMKLYASGPNVLNKYWSLPTWMCSESKMDVTVSGLVEFNASGKAQEDFVILT